MDVQGYNTFREVFFVCQTTDQVPSTSGRSLGAHSHATGITPQPRREDSTSPSTNGLTLGGYVCLTPPQTQPDSSHFTRMFRGHEKQPPPKSCLLPKSGIAVPARPILAGASPRGTATATSPFCKVAVARGHQNPRQMISRPQARDSGSSWD